MREKDEKKTNLRNRQKDWNVHFNFSYKNICKLNQKWKSIKKTQTHNKYTHAHTYLKYKWKNVDTICNMESINTFENKLNK